MKFTLTLYSIRFKLIQVFLIIFMLANQSLCLAEDLGLTVTIAKENQEKQYTRSDNDN